MASSGRLPLKWAKELTVPGSTCRAQVLGHGLEICWGLRDTGAQDGRRSHTWNRTEAPLWLLTTQSQQAHHVLGLRVGAATGLLQVFWVTAYCPCFSFSDLKHIFVFAHPEPYPPYIFGFKE